MARILAAQTGLISRAQVIAAGGQDHDVARMLRRRRWAAIHPGVYADHTGPLSRGQQEWAAVLLYWPAALGGPSALARYGVRTGRDREAGTTHPVHLVVERSRRVSARPDIELTRISRFDAVVLHHVSPPRVRLEHAALDVASGSRDETGAVAVLCDAVQSRRTTAARLLAALDDRPRLPRRSLLRPILDDAATGSHSVLEREYLRRVERAHSLPAGLRQRRVRDGRTSVFRDVEYLPHGIVVELDGRLGHELRLDRWDDLDRDVLSATRGDLTVRLGWGQVLEPCRVAAAIGSILRSRGWTGCAGPCSSGCVVSPFGGVPHAPGA